MSESEDLTPTPTQAQLDAIKRGEVGVTDVADTAVEIVEILADPACPDLVRLQRRAEQADSSERLVSIWEDSCAYTQRELNAAERSLEQHREFLRHLYASEAGRELGRQVCALMVDTRKDPIPRHIDPDAKR